jgi:DNA-directed RNA polymerase specialized sigma24 family protein
MKIPANMTEDEVIATITRIANRLAPRYVFASYDAEDIFQEAFMMGMAGLESYDESRPLSNFLFTHISNRLKNFKRDNYFRLDIGTGHQIQTQKKNLLEALDISSLHSVCEADQTPQAVAAREILKIIDERLPHQWRKDYLKLKAGAKLPKGRKTLILTIIKELFNEEG